MPEYRLIKRRDHSKYWYIGWSEGHRSRRAPTGTQDHGEALEILRLFELERNKPKEAKPEEIAIKQVLGWYWAEIASKKPSGEQAKIAIARFNAFFGEARVSIIDGHSHRLYLEQREADGVGWQTINRERMILRAALRHAWKNHGLLSVPYVPTIKKDDDNAAPVEPRGRPLSIKELAQLYSAAKADHLRRFILVLMGTLCRPDAALDLRARDQLDFQHRLIILNPPGRKQTKKQRPTVPMPNFLENELKGIKRKYVIEYHGQPVLRVKTAWRRLRAEAGLDAKVNPYSIRHTLSRELRSRGVPGDQIGIMLGHRPENASRTDLVYAPYAPDYCREAARAIEAVYVDVMAEVARQSRANFTSSAQASKKSHIAKKRDTMRLK